ncbi:hypothetical protein [Nostoc sp. PCC 9305]|uniref:hypothetical protein n=1 Tax=Nostoc sp. PCC 9305 TaxID=296636 RepID=UPI0039C63438
MHNYVKSLADFVLYARKTLAYFSQNQLTKKFSVHCRVKTQTFKLSDRKFADLDRLLFWFSGKFEKLATANSTPKVNRDSVVCLEAICSQAVLVF